MFDIYIDELLHFFDRGGDVLYVVFIIAFFLWGLLIDRVTGMIEVFDVMAIIGNGDVKSMANGVSMATIPTMAGMVIALSGILFEKKLETSINYQVDKFDLEISKVI